MCTSTHLLVADRQPAVCNAGTAPDCICRPRNGKGRFEPRPRLRAREGWTADAATSPVLRVGGRVQQHVRKCGSPRSEWRGKGHKNMGEVVLEPSGMPDGAACLTP